MKLKEKPGFKELFAELRVLIVDDFEMGRTMLKNVLTAVGLPQGNMDEAGNGREALEKLRAAGAKPYGLVLSDWQMPEMTGIDLLKTCRADAKLGNIPFVMVTSEADPESVLLAMKSGATDYIPKPASPEDLERKFAKIFASAVKFK